MLLAYIVADAEIVYAASTHQEINPDCAILVAQNNRLFSLYVSCYLMFCPIVYHSMKGKDQIHFLTLCRVTPRSWMMVFRVSIRRTNIYWPNILS